MREIKFRAWDKKEKVMLDSREGSNFEIEVTARGDFLFIVGDKTGNLIPMQFTGLKDKNGKEIYEGDIIRKQKYAYGKKSGQMLRVIKWEDKLLNHGFMIPTGEIEIIGNIYENKDLLK